MASEHKLDMILRRMEEFERRRVEAEQTRRADFQSLKAALASWIPHVQNNTEDSHFLVGNKQYKMTPTMCSTECFSPNVEPNLAVDVVVTCATTSMTSVDLVSAEDAIGATYIYNPVQPMVTPAKCLTNCSNPNNIPDLTVAAVVTCTSTSLASMDLEVGKDVACTTEIDGPDCHKETHTKCSMLGLDVKGGADHVGGVFLTMSGVAKSVPISIESIDIFSARLVSDLKQDIPTPTGCLLRIPRYDSKTQFNKKLRLEGIELKPWPPPTYSGVISGLEFRPMPWPAFIYCWLEEHLLDPWPPPTEWAELELWPPPHENDILPLLINGFTHILVDRKAISKFWKAIWSELGEEWSLFVPKLYELHLSGLLQHSVSMISQQLMSRRIWSTKAKMKMLNGWDSKQYLSIMRPIPGLFVKLIQDISPKSHHQAYIEAQVAKKFLENFGEDKVHFLAQSIAVPDTHLGQGCIGCCWLYGPNAISTFHLLIAILHIVRPLYMENIFTRTSHVAKKWATDLKGVVFDWNTLGIVVQEVNYIELICDRDSYGCSVQKCYPQSILFMHNGWSFGGLLDWNSKQYKNSMLIVNPLELMQVLLVPLVWDPDAEMGQIGSYALQPENCQLTTCMRAHCIKPSDYEIITAKENHAADAPRLLIVVMEDEGNTVWTLEFSVSGVVQKKRDLWLCAFAVNKDMKVVMFLQQYGYANLVIVNLLSVPWDPGGSHLALAIKQGTRLSLWAITSIGWLCFLWSYWLHYKRNSNRGDQVGEACTASSHRLGDKPNFKGRRMLGAMWAAIWAGSATFQEVQASPRGNHI
uniref:Uncharacterized protein n=1 Tax=Oryza rufipogon TaxID=4529 RepID=A0A0E0RJI8_ORYRU